MRAIASFVSVVLFATCAGGEESPPAVGDLGNPDRIVVEGAVTFSAAQIVEELFGDLHLANAAYPTARLDDFRRIVAEKTVAGYKSEGFAEVKAEARLHESLGKLVLSIAEGPRYTAGHVEVSGLPETDAERLRQELTAEPYGPDDNAVGKSSPPNRARRKLLRWPVGKPAWCADEELLRFRQQIVDLVLERGRLFPKFTLAARLDREDRTATLEVVFTDPGQPARLDEIRIAGNKANSREEILNCLGLTPGMPYSGTLLTRTTDRLAGSGRFIKPRVRLIKPAAPGEPLAMSIHLSEYDKAPLLRCALSKEEASLVKLSEWLAAFNDSQEDLLMTANCDGMAAEVTLAPRSGILAVFRKSSDEEKTQAPFAFAIVIDENHLALYSTGRRRQLHLVNRPHHIRASVELRLHTEPPTFEGCGRLSFGLGASSRASGHGLLDAKVNATAVSMLSLAHEYQSQMSWDNDILTVAYQGRQITFDGATGRLLKLREPRREGSASEIVVAEGEFERRLREVEAVCSIYPNDADAEKPLTSVLSFLGAELATWVDDDIRQGINVVQRLLQAGLLHPFERRLTATAPPKGSEFSLPVGEDFEWNSADLWSTARRVLSYLVSDQIDSWVPRGSWPERLAREAALASFGKSGHLHGEIIRQSFPPNVGPLRHLGIALTLRMAGLNDEAARYAWMGSYHLSSDEFRNDCEGLLDPSLLVGESVVNTCRVLGQLGEEEAATLCQGLVRVGVVAESDRDTLAAGLARLRSAAAGQPPKEAIYELLGILWQAGLKDGVADALRWLARNGSSAASREFAAERAAEKKPNDDHPFTPYLPFGPVSKRQAGSAQPRYR